MTRSGSLISRLVRISLHGIFHDFVILMYLFLVGPSLDVEGYTLLIEEELSG